MSFLNKPQPDKSSVSPVRSVSIMPNDTNENNDESNSKFANLNASVESKRNLLHKLYDDMKSTADKLKTNNPNILKHVYFESIDGDNDNDITERPIFNSTYTVNQINKSSPLASIGNKTRSAITPKIQQDKTKSPKSSNIITKVQITSTKVGTKPRNTSSSPTKTIKPKPTLTLQQKRQKLLEEKAKQRQDLEILKRKVILRKYAYIWLRRYLYSSKYRYFQFSQSTYTGFKFLLPSQAILFNEQRQARISLKIWHENVRFQRNEWRSTVKANCHFKYVILNKLWIEWRAFVDLQKEEAKKDRISDDFYAKNLKRKYYYGWIEENKDILKKKAKLDEIKELRNNEILKECFKKWYYKYTDKYIELKSYRIADEQFRYVQLAKCYSIWHSKFLDETENRQKIRMADQHHRYNLLKKCFHSMKIYRIYRRKKAIQKLKLKEYYESQLVYRIYHTWINKYEMKKKIHELESVIENFKNRYLEARVFQYWKSAYKYKIELRIREIKVRKYYEKNLKRKAFDAIKYNYLESKNQQTNEIKAEAFERLWIKKIFWSKWSDKLEEKKEINSLHLMYKANKFYESNLIIKCLNEWKIFIIEMRNLNTKIEIADNHYSKLIERRYFNAITVYVEITKQKRANYKKAIEFERFNTCYKIFTGWTQKYELSLETQMNTRIAILHHESKVKTSIYKIWNTKMKNLLKDQLNEKLALFNYRRCLIRSSFRTWKSYVIETKSCFINEIMAVKYDFKRTCLPFFNTWKLYKQNSLAIKNKYNEASKVYEQKLCKQILAIWTAQTKELRKINCKTNELFQMKQIEKKKSYFYHWLEQTRQSKAEKSNEQLAITFYLKHLMIKIIREWNYYASNKAIKIQNDRIMLEKFEKIKSKLIINKYYTIWSKRTSQSIEYNVKLNQAVKFCNKKIYNRSFVAWRIYLKHCWHKKILNNQAIWFDEMRLKTEFYYNWSQKYKEEVNSRDKNQQALILWSINIQRKCLQAWFDWHKLKKQKKKLYKMALEKRQIDILKVCGRNFLKFSTDSIVRRSNATKQLKEKYLIDSIELQFKYFHVWLSKCKFSSIKKEENINVYNTNYLSKVKVDTILVKATLEKSDKFNDAYYSSIKCDQLTKIRPPPRKPIFLNDSIDLSNTNSLLHNDAYFNTLKLDKIIEKSNLNKESQQFHTPKQTTVLLPPSAFITQTISNIQNENIFYPNSIIEPRVMTPSPRSTLSTIGQEEVMLELNLKKINSVPNLNLAGDATNRTIVSESNKSIPKKQKPSIKTKHEQLELVELKKRLEIISIKTENLKRLKEQEKLLIKCIESAEINKTSMCDTIYEEKDQVQAEIEELNKFLRNEKAQVSDLAKKYNLA